MDTVRAIPSPPTCRAGDRTRPYHSLRGQELPRSLDDPLLALKGMVFGVDPDIGVILEKLPVLRGKACPSGKGPDAVMLCGVI